MIREIGAKLAAARQVDARPLPGKRIERRIITGGAPDHVVQRQAAIAAAIRFLKTRAILVDVIDRNAAIRKYSVSGRWQHFLAEDVIAIAKKMGMGELG